jgi:hypothetical protein
MKQYHNVPKDEAARAEREFERVCTTHSEKSLDAICNDVTHFKRKHQLDEYQMQFWYDLYAFCQREYLRTNLKI